MPLEKPDWLNKVLEKSTYKELSTIYWKWIELGRKERSPEGETEYNDAKKKLYNLLGLREKQSDEILRRYIEITQNFENIETKKIIEGSEMNLELEFGKFVVVIVEEFRIDGRVMVKRKDGQKFLRGKLEFSRVAVKPWRLSF